MSYRRVHAVSLRLLGWSCCGLVSLPCASLADVFVDQNAKHRDAYVVLQAEMIDPPTFFQKYAVPAEVEVSAHGGVPLVATFDKHVVEGAWDNNWTIVLKFPSLTAAKNWYHSDNYQAVLPYRYAATAYGNMVFFEGIPESTIAWRVSRYDGVAARLTFPQTLDPNPEYIVTVVPNWTGAHGRFRVSASFDPVNATGARLSVDIKLPTANAEFKSLAPRILLKDAAGRRLDLGRLYPRRLAPDDWYRFEFSGSRDRAGVTQHDVAESIDLSRIDAVEFEFRAQGQVPPPAGDIQIKNLKIAAGEP